MKSYKLLLAFTLFLAFAFNMKAQYVHERSDQYTPPEDSLVIQKLHHWQDQKFGMLIHWGLYSVAGIVESWSICSEEADWIPRDSTMAYEDYKKWYWGLKDSFNPTRFDPEQWAQAAKSAPRRIQYVQYGFLRFFNSQRPLPNRSPGRRCQIRV